MKAVMLCFPLVALFIGFNSIHMKYTPNPAKADKVCDFIMECEEIIEQNGTNM